KCDAAQRCAELRGPQGLFDAPPVDTQLRVPLPALESHKEDRTCLTSRKLPQSLRSPTTPSKLRRSCDVEYPRWKCGVSVALGRPMCAILTAWACSTRTGGWRAGWPNRKNSRSKAASHLRDDDVQSRFVAVS